MSALCRVTGRPLRILGSIERERPNDGVSTDLQSLPKPFDVSGLLLGCVEKVESRPVVPDIIPRLRTPSGDVRDNPFRPIGIATKSLSRRRECRSRQIEHRDILMPRGQQESTSLDAPPPISTIADDVVAPEEQ